MQALPERAAGAPPGVQLGGFAAARAAVEERRVGLGAGRAQRCGDGPAAGQPDVAAAGAPGPALPAGVAPRLPGEVGDLAGRRALTDRAGPGLHRTARRAQRPCRRPDADRATPAAPHARLLIRGVSDQTVGTQRFPVFVAGSCLPPGAAPRAGFGAGLGHAVAAQPQPVAWFHQRDHPAAVWTGRAHDTARAGRDQGVDEPQHRRHTGVGAGAGQQFGAVLHGPGQLVPPTLPGRDTDRGGHRGRVQHGIDRGDDPAQDLHRVDAVLRSAGSAQRSSSAVPASDATGLPAPHARFQPGTADPAVPMLAAALQGAQRLPAVGADRRRDRHRPGPAQRDQQIPDRPGRR